MYIKDSFFLTRAFSFQVLCLVDWSVNWILDILCCCLCSALENESVLLNVYYTGQAFFFNLHCWEFTQFELFVLNVLGNHSQF